MSNELSRINFTEDQVQLIKKQIAPQANDLELKLFLYQCQRTGLDPLTRQIYCVHRVGRMTIQTSIDGFRVIAERSGDYAGQDEPQFTYDESGHLESAKVTVYRFRGDIRYPAAVGVAYYKEYYPNPVNLQKSMPRTMLAKVAEALALRKAYPQDLSGLYTGDEMQQAEVDEVGDNGRNYLLKLLGSSTYDHDTQDKMIVRIEAITRQIDYDKALQNLEANQGGIDVVTNPSAKDIKQYLQKLS